MSITLEGSLREVLGKKCRSLRNNGIIPGQIFNSKHNINVQFEEKALQNVLKEAGTTSLIEVKVEGKKHNVLVKETQYSLNRQKVTNIDFYEVNMKEKVVTTVPVKMIGNNPLIEEKGAVLVLGADSIDIEVLPTKIPDVIEVDVAIIKTFSDSIKASTINLPDGISLVSNPDTMIATYSETRATRQQEAEEQEAEGDEQVEEGSSSEDGEKSSDS